MSDSLSNVRTDYTKGELNENDLPQDPHVLFSAWLEEANTKTDKNFNAMQVATVDQTGFPQTRIVLLRDNPSSGPIFYTNYNSAKGNQIDHSQKGALAFFWKELERQVRLTGMLEKVDASVSDAYFASRPRASQIGAWASDQSALIEGRTLLSEKVDEMEKRFEGIDVPRPPHWGGYQLKVHRYEFWQGRASRLHDRIVYNMKELGSWSISRIQP